jgi:hypothetical protein
VNTNPQNFTTMLCGTLIVALAALPASAQTVPPVVNYQDRLVNSNNVPLSPGDCELRFSIWNAATSGSGALAPRHE